jgi:hypothetical protein
MAYRHPDTGKFISKASYEQITGTHVAKVDLPSMISAVPQADVTAMVTRLNRAMDARERFERSKAPNGSHIELRRAKAFLRGNRRLAAFLCVTGSDPDEMINRTRKEGTRANLKGFQKLKKLLDYVTNRSLVFERVSLALFASTIIAANKGIGWISSQEQELILSNVPVSSLSKEIQDAIASYKHKYMTLEGDSRNQSCQFRTTFSNLGMFFFAREDTEEANSLGIMVNMESPVIQYLNQRWNLDSAS